MADEQATRKQDIHRYFAVNLFNHAWSLIDLAERTPEQEAEMIHAAHASRYHWGQVGTALEWQRGEWQISRVYAILKRPEAAGYHAGICLATCLKEGIGDFDLAFAYEALARAGMLKGDRDATEQYLETANQAGKAIRKKEDREYFFSELKTISASV